MVILDILKNKGKKKKIKILLIHVLIEKKFLHILFIIINIYI